MMRKITLTAILLCLLTMAQAQVKMHVKAGIGSSDYIGSQFSNRTSYKIGAGAGIPLTGLLFVEPSLFLTQKGATFTGYYGSEQLMEATFSQRLNYLELPIQLGIRTDIGQDVGLIFRAGGYAAWGIKGKTKMKINSTDSEYTFPGNLFSSRSTLNGISYDRHSKPLALPKYDRLDLGLACGADLRVKHLLIGLDMSIGLRPIYRKHNEPDNIEEVFINIFTLGLYSGTNRPTNINGSITLGYEF